MLIMHKQEMACTLNALVRPMYSIDWEKLYRDSGACYTSESLKAPLVWDMLDLDFTANKLQHWAHVHGIHWSYHILCYLVAVGLKEWWNGLLKTLFQHKLGDNFSGLGQGPLGGHKARNQCPVYATVSLVARLMGPGINEWKWGWYHFLLYLVTY